MEVRITAPWKLTVRLPVVCVLSNDPCPCSGVVRARVTFAVSGVSGALPQKGLIEFVPDRGDESVEGIGQGRGDGFGMLEEGFDPGAIENEVIRVNEDLPETL